MNDKNKNIVFIPEDKKVRRWMFTINNPIFKDSDLEEVDISKTDLEIVDNTDDLKVLSKPENVNLFEFKYVKKYFEKEQKEKVVKRPFFKDLESIQTYIKNITFKYCVFQYEKGSTYHIQGFIIYPESKRFKNVKQEFLTAHLEPADGTNFECRNYCMKEETRVAGPFEFGDFAEMKSRTDILQFHEELEEGASNMELKASFPNLYSSYGPAKIESFRQDYFKDKYSSEMRDVKVTFIYGKTRTGKTSFIYDNFPMSEICRVTDYDRGTFENYQQQKVLVLDEFTGEIKINYLNNLLDKYPVDLSARFANRMACYNEVYIISNLSLKQLYKEEQNNSPEVYEAFLARIKNIIHFTDVGKYVYEMKDGKVDPSNEINFTDLL